MKRKDLVVPKMVLTTALIMSAVSVNGNGKLKTEDTFTLLKWWRNY